MISVNPTASEKHLSLNVWLTDGIARKYFGTSKCLSEMGELVALSFLKFESCKFPPYINDRYLENSSKLVKYLEKIFFTMLTRKRGLICFCRKMHLKLGILTKI